MYVCSGSSVAVEQDTSNIQVMGWSPIRSTNFGHVKRNCMTAPEYGSGLERVAGWNPAVVTSISIKDIFFVMKVTHIR